MLARHREASARQSFAGLVDHPDGARTRHRSLFVADLPRWLAVGAVEDELLGLLQIGGPTVAAIRALQGAVLDPQSMSLFLEGFVRQQPCPDTTFRVATEVLADQDTAVVPSTQIAREFERVSLSMEVVATLRLHLVATDATRDRGIGHGGLQPPLGRATPHEGVLRRRWFYTVVPAVGIAAAVEICVARNTRVYLREREIIQALHLVRSFGPFLGQELAHLLDWPLWPTTKSDARQRALVVGSSNFPSVRLRWRKNQTKLWRGIKSLPTSRSAGSRDACPPGRNGSGT